MSLFPCSGKATAKAGGVLAQWLGPRSTDQGVPDSSPSC